MSTHPDSQTPAAPDAPLFRTSLEEVVVGSMVLRLHVVSDIDEAIDHYVATAPDDTCQIPYYTRLWESSLALAEAMAARPALWPGRRVLELGCGLGLPAMVAARLGARVTATDFHPDNEAFFLRNAHDNGLADIRYERLDWRRPHLEGDFDIVLGSDLIYEREMVQPFVRCARRYCAPGGLLFFADPGRRNLQDACDALEAAGFVGDFEPRGEIYVFTLRRAGAAAAVTGLV